MTTQRNSTITVAIVTRDRPEYLHRAITSALSGRTVPDRVVVIDNSQRNSSVTRQICEQFTRVEYAAPVGNLTMAGNHNRAIDSADTEYVCVLHDDDVYSPEFLAQGVAALSADPKAAVFAVNYGLIDGEDRPVRDRAWYQWQAGTLEPAEYVRYAVSNHSPVHFSAAMMRTAPAQKCRMTEVDGNCADMRYFFEMGSVGRVILCDEPLVLVRLHQATLSTEAGFMQSRGSRHSEALALVPLEWATKRRYLASPEAARVLGENLTRVRIAAARQAVRRLAQDLRGYPLRERVRVVWAIVPILPYLVGA